MDLQINFVIHLANEVELVGVVSCHCMFLLEKYMNILKYFLRQRVKHEGYIAEGYYIVYKSFYYAIGYKHLWLRCHDPGASKPSKSLGDRTQPGPHQPLTWLDLRCPQGFQTDDFHLQSALTTHSLTDCSRPRGLLNLKDMGVGFDPLMCARVTIPFNIVSLGATTRSTTTSRCPHGSR
jgi:hypothetical protein